MPEQITESAGNMAFYGLPKDKIPTLYAHLSAIQELYDEANVQGFFGDNLIALSRNLSFAADDAFMSAVRDNQTDEDGEKLWRLHVCCWAARGALSLAGDFVECGVYKGQSAGVVAQYLTFGAQNRSFYLYDTFTGLVETLSTQEERDEINPHYEWDGTYQAVVEKFAPFENIHVVKGIVPDVFATTSPEHIAFLHLDMNSGIAETAALDALFDSIVTGGFILMDDFGRYEQRALCETHYAWWQTRGQQVLELPTGQGLVIKTPG